MFYRVEDIPDRVQMQAVVAELLPLVPFVRRDKALRYTHLHGQYCCLRCWRLLHELLIEHSFLPSTFPLSDLTYTENECGKPLLRAEVYAHIAQGGGDGNDAICFSISHTKDAIAVAVDRRAVGIDVEDLVHERMLNETFLKRTMSTDEQERIFASADPRVAFTRLWTQKEALLKAQGTGIRLDTLPDVLAFISPYRIDSFAFHGAICSIAYHP